MTNEYTCVYCKNGQVEEIVEDQPYNDTHWQCENCDSTYPSQVYPKDVEGVDK